MSYLPQQQNPGYDPLRAQDQGDELFLRGQQVIDQRNAGRAQRQLQAGAQASNDQYRQANLDQQANELAQRGDQFQQEQGLREREQDLREDQFSSTAPNQGITDANGQEYQGTRSQAVQVRNLGSIATSDEDYQQGIRKIFGVAEPLVPYETPEGQTIPLTAKDAAARMATDRAAKTKAQSAADALEEKSNAHYDLIQYQNERLDLERQKYRSTDAKTLAEIDGKLVVNQKYMQAGLEKAAGLEVTQARHDVDDYIKAKGFVPVNDPQLLKLQEAVKVAMAAEKKVIDQGRAAATQPTQAPANAPGRNTPPQTPTQGPGGSQRGGTAGQPPKYARIAQDPDGRKIGWNPITKAWETIQTP